MVLRSKVVVKSTSSPHFPVWTIPTFLTPTSILLLMQISSRSFKARSTGSFSSDDRLLRMINLVHELCVSQRGNDNVFTTRFSRPWRKLHRAKKSDGKARIRQKLINQDILLFKKLVACTEGSCFYFMTCIVRYQVFRLDSEPAECLLIWLGRDISNN